MKPVFTYNGKPYEFADVALKYHKVRMALPPVIGTIAVNYFKDSFRRQGWRDRTLKAWEKRKAGTKNNKGRAILVRSGRLRNSIRIVSADVNRIVVGSDVPYASAHNEGAQGQVQVRAFKRKRYARSTVHSTQVFSIKSHQGVKSTVTNVTGDYPVRSHTRNMNLPQRQFMGDSYVMFLKIDKEVGNRIMTIF
jgi:phage gpG-like protein